MTALMLYLFTNNSLLIIPRLVLIHFRHWDIAIECLDRIDRILNQMSHNSCTTRQRTIFGFCVMIGMVFILQVFSNRIYFQIYLVKGHHDVDYVSAFVFPIYYWICHDYSNFIIHFFAKLHCASMRFMVSLISSELLQHFPSC